MGYKWLKSKMKSNFIEIALRHGCSPVHLLLIFRTTFFRNVSGWLLLNIFYYVILYWIITLPTVNQSSLISSTYYDWGISLGRKITLSVAGTPVKCLYYIFWLICVFEKLALSCDLFCYFLYCVTKLLLRPICFLNKIFMLVKMG